MLCCHNSLLCHWPKSNMVTNTIKNPSQRNEMRQHAPEWFNYIFLLEIKEGRGGVEREWDFFGIWCSQMYSIWFLHVLTECPMVIYHVLNLFPKFSQQVPNISTLYPIYFAQCLPLVNYIGSPKEKSLHYDYLRSGKSLLATFRSLGHVDKSILGVCQSRSFLGVDGPLKQVHP